MTDKTSTLKTAWDMKKFYRSLNDPQIKKDIVQLEKACLSFKKKWGGKITEKTSIAQFKKACKEYEALYELLENPHPIVYPHLLLQLNSMDTKAEKLFNSVYQSLTQTINEVLFFDLSIGKLSHKKLKHLQSAKELAPYKYILERIEVTSKHDLPEEQEKIVNLKSLPARQLWVSGVEKSISKRSVTMGKKRMTLQEALNMIPNLPVAKRRKLHDQVMHELGEVADFAESELNALYLDKKTMDGLRGYEKPYSQTVMQYHNSEAGVETLVKTVTKNFKTCHKYYQLKKELLGLPELHYADRQATLGKHKKKFTFEKSSRMLRELLYDTKKEYGEIYDRFVSKGHIDVYPRKGKSGVAFCAGGLNMPTYILLNHVDEPRSASTLAHEVGHGLHTERSKSQAPLYQEYTTSAAETASTFFETLFMERMLNEMSPDEQIVALHDKLQDEVATVYRQIAVFNFEHDLHTTIREQGGIEHAGLQSLLNKHMKAYLGPAFTFKPLDGNFYIMWSHIRRFFYVYSYTYGHLISKQLVANYTANPDYIDQVDFFLSAGGSDTPDNTFKKIGVDTSKAEVFETGLKSIEADVKKLAKLMKS